MTDPNNGYKKCIIYHCENYTHDIICFDCWCVQDVEEALLKSYKSFRGGRKNKENK